MEELFTLTPLVLGAIPLVIGLVQVAKAMKLPDNFAPLASLVLGCALVALTGATWQASLVQGIIVGLSASGLYSGGKATGEMLKTGAIE